MSQPRRRRRRRRRSGGESGEARTQSNGDNQPQSVQPQGTPARARRSRRRGRRGRSSEEHAAPAQSSEDLVRALPKERPGSLTAPADGQKLEDIIGDLQSEWGVPQYPQEYRITVKVAEEPPAKERTVSLEEVAKERVEASAAPAAGNGGAPRREKAPAPPRVAGAGRPVREQAPSRRRKRSRGRRGRRGDAS